MLRDAVRMLGKATIGSVSVLALFVVLMLVSVDAVSPEYRAPQLYMTASSTVSLSAQAWGVVDVTNNTLVLAHNQTEVLPIASVTKLVTAAALRNGFDTLATTTITWSDIATEGRAGSLVPGDVLTYHELLFPLLLESSNDAAATLARSLGDNTLVLAMNDYVAVRSLQNTVFTDPSGLSEKNVSTVRNLASVASDIYKEQPHLIDITGLDEYLVRDYGWRNNSPFVGDDGYVGGKHGFTPEAGRTAVAYFEESYPEGTVTMAYIVLGSNDSKADIDTLREFISETTVYK